MAYISILLCLLLSSSFVLVKSQSPTCYAKEGCQSNFTMVATVDECCNHNLAPSGLAYTLSGIDGCNNCPLEFGFFETSFSGIERGETYSAFIGTVSGPNPDIGLLQVTIEVELGDTNSNDVTLSTRSLTFFRDRNKFLNGIVSFGLLVDGLSQEIDETFTLRLVASTLPSTHMLISGMNITIMDSDIAVFRLSEADYSSSEGNAPVVQVKISKERTVRIANPVTFQVTPLTVDEARRKSRSIPNEIENMVPNPDSPPLAVEADFNSTVFTVVFPADEFSSSPGPDVNAFISVVDDDINESQEQLFLTYVDVVNATNFNLLNNTERNVAICRIVDDDPMIIGFERMRYTFEEPPFILVKNVTLVKENNQRTEQSFLVVVTVVQAAGVSMATRSFTGDYRVVAVSQVIRFAANVDRESYGIFLFDDNFAEGDEGFALTSSPSRDSVPYIRPQPSGKTFISTTVIISDNDPIIVGFEEPLYQVNESAGSVEVCVIVSNPRVDMALPIQNSVVLTYVTVTGTAGSMDYTEVSPNNEFIIIGESLANQPELRRKCFNISITRDDTLEITESLTLNLNLSMQDTSGVLVSIQPNVTEIQILDNDAIVIGFVPTSYRVGEGAGSVSLNIQVITGSLDTDIEVRLTTADGTALSGSDYNSLNTILTFSNSVSVSNASVTIIVDTEDENDELFNANLALVVPNARVQLNPSAADVTIVDDDMVRIGFEQPKYMTLENKTIQVCARVFTPPTLGRQVIVVIATQDDTAIAPADYIAVMAELTFDPSNMRRCLLFTPPDDDIIEGPETFNVTLISTDNVTLVPDTTVVEIEEIEMIMVMFEQSSYSFNENDGTVSIFVVKVGNSDEPFEVRVRGGPSMQNDVTISAPAIDDIIAFDSGEMAMNRVQIDLIIIDDNVALEPIESYIARLEILTGGDVTIGTPEETVINVHDDDVVTVRFEQPTYTFAEDASVGEVCLIKVGRTAGPLNVTSIDAPDMTSTGPAAIAGVDYVSGPYSVTFSARDNDRQCFNVRILPDSDSEPPETFKIDLNLPSPDNLIRPGNPPKTIITIQDTGTQVNDTVIGDPLYTVPILVSDEQLRALNVDKLSLCYEVHGESGQWFNLVTDECASVNTRYSSLSPRLNIMEQIGVRVVDDSNKCINIGVDVNQCDATINGVNLTRYSVDGVNVRRYSNRVRISVPNCAELTLVMWVICERRTLDNPDIPGTQLTGNMIKFVVMRGLNFGHRQAHGLLGQFWNIPVDISPYTGRLTDGSIATGRYIVNITTGNKPRSYTGWMYQATWDHTKEPCLYVGNSQSGPIAEVSDPNDPVIASIYKNYKVDGAYSEENYDFGLFDDSKCAAGSGTM